MNNGTFAAEVTRVGDVAAAETAAGATNAAQKFSPARRGAGTARLTSTPATCAGWPSVHRTGEEAGAGGQLGMSQEPSPPQQQQDRCADAANAAGGTCTRAVPNTARSNQTRRFMKRRQISFRNARQANGITAPMLPKTMQDLHGRYGARAKVRLAQELSQSRLGTSLSGTMCTRLIIHGPAEESSKPTTPVESVWPLSSTSLAPS